MLTLGNPSHLPEKILQAQLNAGAQVLSFLSHRIKAQAAFLHDLSHSGDAAAISGYHSGFMDIAAKDYARELNQLTDIVQRNFETFSAFMECDGRGKNQDKNQQPGRV